MRRRSCLKRQKKTRKYSGGGLLKQLITLPLSRSSYNLATSLYGSQSRFLPNFLNHDLTIINEITQKYYSLKKKSSSKFKKYVKYLIEMLTIYSKRFNNARIKKENPMYKVVKDLRTYHSDKNIPSNILVDDDSVETKQESSISSSGSSSNSSGSNGSNGSSSGSSGISSGSNGSSSGSSGSSRASNGSSNGSSSNSSGSSSNGSRASNGSSNGSRASNGSRP
jgi:hypothetical protein